MTASRFGRILFYFSVLLFAAGLLIFSKDTSNAAVSALSLCGRTLIPSLFPFFVLSSVITGSGLGEGVGRSLEKPMRFLFDLPGTCAPAFILGVIGGYPVGAATAAQIYKKGLCEKAEAERLLSFCNNCGPAFILGVCGVALFGRAAAGVLLFLSHIAASVTCGILFRFYGRGRRADEKRAHGRKAPSPVPSLPPKEGGAPSPDGASPRRLFLSAVKTASRSVLGICAYVIFFSVAVRLLQLFGVIPAAARLLHLLLRPLGADLNFSEKLVGGFFEVTAGVYGIASTGAALGAKLCAAAFMLGWAGLSVHFQVLEFIGDCGLSPLPYVTGKLLHGLFSALYVYVGTLLIPFDAEVSRLIVSQLSQISDASFFTLLSFSLLCCLFLFGVFALLRKRKKLK